LYNAASRGEFGTKCQKEGERAKASDEFVHIAMKFIFLSQAKVDILVAPRSNPSDLFGYIACY